MIKIHCREFVEWASESALFDDCKYHAVLCDPPYGIAFMGKKWDDHGGPEAFQLQAKIWGEAMIPLLYPGALVFMFAGTRMWHRLAAGMEDAGFHLWDTVMWLHGQGFPKAQDISKLIDKANGDPRTKIVGRYQPPGMDKPWNLKNAKDERTVPLSASSRNNLEILAPGSDTSAPWVGHKTPQLKPAWEPILCFRAPNNGKKYAELALEYGSGSLNIENARIGTSKDVPASPRRAAQGPAYGDLSNDPANGTGWNPNMGRYPANLVLDEKVASMLDMQSGARKAGASVTGQEPSAPTKNDYGEYERIPFQGYEDSGGASRFFYCTKASRREREEGLGDVEAAKTDSTRSAEQPSMNGGEGNPYKRGCKEVKNNHPTVKPIDLNRWLASLLLPPESVASRRIIIPFAGVGSEIIGASLAGWDEIVGVEMDSKYCDIAKSRIAHWVKQETK